jgi:hypothetical protein
MSSGQEARSEWEGARGWDRGPQACEQPPCREVGGREGFSEAVFLLKESGLEFAILMVSFQEK